MPNRFVMILREADWDRYPNAIPDFKTKNQSFLKHAATLKAMGVKHWYIALALHNPRLQGVDPHDPNLDAATKQDIVYEMSVNPWYYFREVVKIPRDGADPVEFGLHRGNFTLIWSFFNNIDIALLLIRQQGKTVVVAALLVYLMRILLDSRTILMTRGSDLRAETINKMKSIRDTLPGYAWSHSKFDLDNTEQFTYVSRKNKLITCIAQNSENSALNAGRGITTARLFSDETAFTKYVRVMLPAALAAGTTARRIAEAEGIPYCNVFTTTPGKRDEPDGAYAYKLFHDGYLWSESLLDVATRAQLLEIIRKGSKGDRMLIHAPFTHRQLGMTDDDLYWAIANAGGTREEILRDFGLQWTAGSLSSPLTVDEAKMVNDSITDAKHIEIYPNNYTIKWYYEEHEIKDKMRVKHIIGMDTSDAVGRDNIGLVMINSETLEVAATAIVNESNLVVFANWIGEVMVKYENTILVIERKSSAPAMIDALLYYLPAHGVEPTRRMYNTIVQNRNDGDSDLKEFYKTKRPRDETFYEIYRKFIGFVTTGPARRTLYGEVLQTAVRMSGREIRDRNLASELLALVVKDGRIDHKASGHDDMVISWLLAVWFMLNGRRHDYYGVSNRVLMQRNKARQSGVEFDSDEFEDDIREQEDLAEEIDDLCNILAKNRNPMLRARLERQLRILLSRLKMDTSEAATIGELQVLIRNEKLKSRYI